MSRFRQAALAVIEQNAIKAKEKREQLLKGMTQEERLEHMKEHLIKQLASGTRKRDYISKVLTRRDTKEYFMPKDIEGVVTFKNGRWEVEKKVRDETVATILDYVEKRVNTTFNARVNELKVLKGLNKIKEHEKKILEDLEKVLHVTKLPLPQEGCKVVFNVDESVKINAYMWELGLMFTENEVNEERQKISDLELMYKIGEEKFKNKKEAQAAYEAKRAKIKEEHEKTKKERQAKVEAKKKELKLNRAKKMADKKKMPIEAFLELSTYAIINSLKYGDKAFSPNAVIDFSKMPMKEDKKEERKFKELIKILKQKLTKSYYKLREHLIKTPEQRKLEEQKEIKEKKINPIESKLRAESEDKKKQLLDALDDILRTEDPEIELENADDKKKEDAEEQKVVNAGDYPHFAHYEITKKKVKPFDFLKDVRYNIYVKPLKKDFKKLKAKDFYRIVKFLKRDTEDYKQLDPKVWSEYASKVNANDDNIQNCYDVAQLFTKAIYYNPNPTKADPIREQFLGRLGAQTLNSVINAKKLTKEIGWALGLSMGAAGGIAVGLNLFAWPAVIAAVCGGTLGAGCPAAIPLTIFLYSMTPAITETVDSFVIGKLLDSMKGGNFFPKSKKEFWNTLTDASRAGGVSAFGSVFNNVIFYYNTIALNLSAGLFTNVIATATAGAMVPMEIGKMQKSLSAALYMRMKQGFFPAPSPEELAGLVPEVRKSYTGTARQWLKTHVSWNAHKQKQSVPLSEITEEENELALFLYAKKDISFSMEVSKTSGLAINSLGIGSLISMVTYIVMAILDYTGVIQVAVSQVVNILVNQPTEIISLGSGTLTATLLGSRGMKGWLTTDAIKNEQIVDLIFKKTMNQMEKQEKNEPNWEKTEEITSSELHYIYDTIAHKITNVWGKIINRVMNSMIDGLFAGLSTMYNVVLSDDVKLKITKSVGKMMEKMKNFKGKYDVFLQGLKGHFKIIGDEVKGLKPFLSKFKKDKVSDQEVKAIKEKLEKGMGDKPVSEEDADEEWDQIRNDIGK
ncbi:effector protein AvrPphD [Ditylenchus destructor]|uniref:Effector protein AvrPphD n=1 Tax=Ditylenchus destructor TaxID=166010 RepID=A0AAD4R1L0_9BILA|nr:effector protein AvrPphD [Ditylenchus destructor]